MKHTFIILAILVSCSQAIAQYGNDSERILSFHSDIAVNEAGRISVRETIKVVAIGDKIKRGIFRSLPKMYLYKGIFRHSVDYYVHEVSRDGLEEPYHIQQSDDALTIYIGDENVFLNNDTYTYTIHYSVDGLMRFFDHHDELYWNVTGNDWDFVIENASASIMLPVEATIIENNMSAYSGIIGSTICDCTLTMPTHNQATVVMQRSLANYEGLTVALPMEKGIIRQPSDEELWQKVREHNAAGFKSLYLLGGMAAYYFIIWFFVGRDPKPGRRLPMYTLPALQSYEMRYVRRMQYDNKTLVAAIVHLAAEGYIQIEEEKRGTYRISKQVYDESAVYEGDLVILKELFEKNDEVMIERGKPNAVLANVEQALKGHLKSSVGKKYIRNNGGWLALGISLMLASLGYIY